MNLRRTVWLCGLALFLTACTGVSTFDSPLESEELPARVEPRGHDVADLLREPPLPGETVEIDAYYSMVSMHPMMVFHRGPSRPHFISGTTRCPEPWWGFTLTDLPFPAAILSLPGGRLTNVLPDDAPWLIAIAPEAIGRNAIIDPQLPHYARLRGHLGEPALTDCPYAGRIFVVEEVVRVYAETWPDPSVYWPMMAVEGYAGWVRYHDQELGYSIPYPPHWQIGSLDEPGVISTLTLRGPQWPDFPVTVRVYEGVTQTDLSKGGPRAPLWEGVAISPFNQGAAGILYEWARVGSQNLDGYYVNHGINADRGSTALFSAGGHTYEIALRYSLGFNASQMLMNIFSAMILGFQLDAVPFPTATPPAQPIEPSAGFLTQEEAEQRAIAFMPKEGWRIESVILTDEAEVRRLEQTCTYVLGHPDGIWMIRLLGQYEGSETSFVIYMDAASGEVLCALFLSPLWVPVSRPFTSPPPTPTTTATDGG